MTAAGILKLNHQLEAMAKIAAELHEISDKLGENIHEGMMDTMEATEERRKKLEAATAESRKKLEAATEEGRRKLEAATEGSDVSLVRGVQGLVEPQTKQGSSFRQEVKNFARSTKS